MANIKKTNTANAGEDVENAQPQGTAGRNINFYSHSRKPYGEVSNEKKKKKLKVELMQLLYCWLDTCAYCYCCATPND